MSLRGGSARPDPTSDRHSYQELEQRLAESEARAAFLEDRLEDFAAAAGGWFWETDSDNRFTYISQTMKKIAGIDPEFFYGKRRAEVRAPSSLMPGGWEDHVSKVSQRRPFSDFVFLCEVPDARRWMSTSGNPKYDEAGNFIGYRGSAQDVTSEIVERRNLARLTAALHELDEFFVLWDADDKLVVCNQRYQEINIRIINTTRPGTPFEDHIRAAVEAGMFPQAEGREEEWLKERLNQHRNPGTPVEVLRQNGKWLLLREQRLPDGSTVSTSTDITEQKLLQDSLRKLASYDSLTQVYNRGRFLELAEDELSTHVSQQKPCGLIVFDIDRFKEINDRHGHLLGDEAIVFVIDIAREVLGEDGFIGRIGGEEFAVFLPEGGSRSAELADALRDAVENAVMVRGEIELCFTISLGSVSIRDQRHSLVDAIGAADALLYRAKREGRNRAFHEDLDPFHG